MLVNWSPLLSRAGRKSDKVSLGWCLAWHVVDGLHEASHMATLAALSRQRPFEVIPCHCMARATLQVSRVLPYTAATSETLCASSTKFSAACTMISSKRYAENQEAIRHIGMQGL